MPGILLRVLGLACVLVVATAQADAPALQRELFRATAAALERGERLAFTAARPALSDYPLYPYLLQRDLTRRLSDFPTEAVRAFLSEYADLPIAPVLRRDWLRQLAEAGRWEDFLRDYRDTGDVALDCQRRRALLASERTAEALEGITEIWVHGYSRPEACDPVFAVWRERGGFTQERIWRRFELAMTAGQDGLGRYLRNLLAGERRRQAERWLAVHARPTEVLQAGLDPFDPVEGRILLHGLQRWSSLDSVAAAAGYDTLQARGGLPQGPGWDRLQRRLALFVASRGHPDAARRLAALPARLVDADVEAWRVRVALQRRAWDQVLVQLRLMGEETARQPAWRYWRARALEATGDESEATELYTSLAGLRDYYGFLAADRLGRAYAFNHRPLAVEPALLQALRGRPGLIRARELFLLGWLPDARREWRQALTGAGMPTLRAAARLAHDWGWHDRAIVALGEANEWNDLTLRFPLPHREVVVERSRSRGLDPAWVFAVMRQESLFQQDARSGADALGLMQILPATGQRIARDLGNAWRGRYGLLQPAINIRYGAYYLDYTRSELQGSPLLATAAYNAGPNRVRDWLPEGELEADLWVETIPFYETRGYVKRVMEYAAVYAWRLGQEPRPLSTRMPPIRPAG
ncbi:MAG: transglycosylase SLT domain-containing protein [Candidatus Competibacterales bacterium]|nr:transglycosylase SLT domain-containing protein [Candidatus Competibacterales bacterium]